MNAPLLHYKAFGLRLTSPVALPLQAPMSAHAKPDVTICFGEIPLSALCGEERIWRITRNEFWLTVNEVARYYVADGCRIVVEPTGGNAHDIGVFLLGSVFAALLMQRNVVPLQASAVATDTGAVLFLGGSGAGKSSLLAAFAKRGYDMLADDVTGVFVSNGSAVALPAFPNIRLWADTLDALAWRSRAGGRVRAPLDRYWTRPPRFRCRPQSIRACFALAIDQWTAVARVRPQTALGLLGRHTYRKRFLPESGLGATHFRTIAHIADSLPIFQVKRPVGPILIDALADKVEACLAEGR